MAKSHDQTFSPGLIPESPELVLFRLSKGEACTWIQETNLAPKQKSGSGITRSNKILIFRTI